MPPQEDSKAVSLRAACVDTDKLESLESGLDQAAPVGDVEIKEDLKVMLHSYAGKSVIPSYGPGEKSGEEFSEKKSSGSSSSCCKSSKNCSTCTASCCSGCYSKIRHLSWTSITSITLLLAVILITMVFSSDTSFCYFNPVVPLTISSISTPRLAVAHKRTFTVALLGDSMLLDAAEKYALADKMQMFLPDYTLNVSVHANNAVRVKNIRERFQRTLKKENPDGFIIMADSDITDIAFENLPQKKQYGLLSNYTTNLKFIVDTLLEEKKWVAIASPCGVLLEGPFFGPANSARFHDKEGTLNTYTKATLVAANKWNIPYIDIRTPFQEAIPSYRLAYKGCVTRDGEHANDYGTIIMANKFAVVLNDWFSSVTVAAPKMTKPPSRRMRT